MPRQPLRPEAGDSAQETAVGKQMPRQPLRRMALGVIPHHDPASRHESVSVLWLRVSYMCLEVHALSKIAWL